MLRRASGYAKAFLPPAKRPLWTTALSVRVEVGGLYYSTQAVKLSSTWALPTQRWAQQTNGRRLCGPASRKPPQCCRKPSASGCSPPAGPRWVATPRSGWSCCWGRFCGRGLPRLPASSTRLIIKGVVRPLRCRCQAQVSRPAPGPGASTSRHNSTMRALTATLVARALPLGGLLRGSTASNPPAW